MNVSLCIVTSYLKNVTTNFDESLHVVQAYTALGLCIVSAHITHKQKSFIDTLFSSLAIFGFWAV